MTLCPCGSGADYGDCCGPILAGAPAPTAEALMRSRYTAFTEGNIEHIARTHAPEARLDFDTEGAAHNARTLQWQKLEIHQTAENDDGTATVEFSATFRRGMQTLVHHELSQFRKVDGNWMYVEGQINPRGQPRQVTKHGRNEPCPCGSGKKYKKCCGAGP